jgi:hypothetical protein
LVRGDPCSEEDEDELPLETTDKEEGMLQRLSRFLKGLAVLDDEEDEEGVEEEDEEVAETLFWD